MLEGLRVVELGVWVAGPAAAGVLADWGADVIKVEPPGGDPQRRMFQAIGVSVASAPPFELDNRGKRSVVLDLRSDEGREQMARLLATADVFLTNLRLDALERLGLDHATLLAKHPRLVYASVTGYGLEGPDRNRPGYDIGAFWARSSMAAAHVPPGHDADRRPQRRRRPRHRHHHRRRDHGRPVRAGAHGQGPAGVDVAAAHRHVPDGVGSRDLPALRAHPVDPPRERHTAPLLELLPGRPTAGSSG